MTNKRKQLPNGEAIGPGEHLGGDELIDTSGDVEGHGFFPNPAPPVDVTHRSPSQGGEAIPSEDEGVGPQH
jgi:hypothetical protein